MMTGYFLPLGEFSSLGPWPSRGMGRAHDPLMSFWPGKRRWLNEARKISGLAELASTPICAHDTGAIVDHFATVQGAAAVRDFIASETIIGNGTWIDDEGVPNYFIR